MVKESKNLITRNECRKNLIDSAKSTLHFDIMLMSVFGILEVPCLLLGVMFQELTFILVILFSIPFGIPFVYHLCKVIKSIKKVRFAESVEFSIVKDTVFRVSKGEVPKNSSEGKYHVNAIYFEKYGRCIPSSTAFQFAVPGDEFILVVLNTEKKEIVFSYHSKMYECNELDLNKK